MVDIARLGLEVDSKGVVKATKALKKLDGQSGKTEKQTKKLTKSFRGLGTAIGALGLGLAFKSIIAATVEQERAISQLDAALKSTGESAGFTSKELQDMAESLQGVTTFGDEAIISMQSVLLTFTNLKDDVLPATTEAALDLSARMGIDLQSAAVQLGKALNDPVANLSALSRSGIQFSDDQKETIKTLAETNRLAEAQGLILEELQTQFGGSAKAARATFGGALTALSNALGDLTEGEGGSLENARESLEELVTILQSPGMKKAFDELTDAVIGTVSALVRGVVALNEFGTDLGVFLAGGEAKKTLAEVDEEIIAIQSHIERMQAGKEAASKRGVIGKLLLGDEGEFDSAIAKAITKLQELAVQRGALAGNGDTGGEKTGKPKSDGKTGKTSALGMTEEELDAEFERMSEHTDLMLEQIASEDEAKLEAKRNYLERLYDMETGSAKAISDFGKAIAEGDLKTQIEVGSLALSNAAKQSKTMFEIQKAYSLAKATTALPSAVMDSFNNGGGYPWGLVPAGLMLAQGLQQINAIKSSTFGGGGTPAPVSGGSTSPSAPVASGLPPGATATPEGLEQQAPVQREIRVTVEGDTPHSNAMREFIKNLEETAADMGSDTRLVLS